MAVKEGLPATDFSKMNRDYIRNVAEGETVKDGLPATDFSRMNREYIKAVVEESGGGGGGGFMGMQTATITCNFTAPEGYTLDKIAPSWQIVFDDSTYQQITGMVYSDSISSAVVPIIPNETTELTYLNVMSFDNVDHNPVALYVDFLNATLSGGLSYNSENGYIKVTGNGTITATLSVPD